MFWRRDEEEACEGKVLEFLGRQGLLEIGEFPVGEVFPHERNFVGEEMSSGEGVSRKWDFSGTRIFGGNVSPQKGVFPEGKTSADGNFSADESSEGERATKPTVVRTNLTETPSSPLD